MAHTVVDDQRASREEILVHRTELLGLAASHGLENVRVRSDGALLVTAPEPGYRAVARFVGQASEVIGSHVYVITDDALGGESASIPL